MTAEKLIIELQKHPKDMQVFLSERQTEFTYGLLNSVKVTEIIFTEGLGEKEPMATDNCIVLSED